MVITANVALPAWQAVMLILLSFGSLGIALYCLLFMVPLKKFVQRIESLGGGMEGLKKHLSGIETHLGKELQRIEALQSDQLDHVKTKNHQGLQTVEQQMEHVKNELNRFGKTVETLKESAQGTEQKLARTADKQDGIDGHLRELRRDMSVLAEETGGKLQKKVREAFYELEATVLSTLEVLRDELLTPKPNHPTSPRDSSALSHSSKRKHPHKNDSDHATGNKIISAGPLFSRPNPAPEEDEKEEEGQEEDDTP